MNCTLTIIHGGFTMTQKMIAPSILSADFSRLGEEVRAVEAAGAQLIHVDVMDGHFVPNITVGPVVVKAVKKVTRLPLDVHLMIQNPQKYIPEFIEAGASWVSVHVEEEPHLDRTLNLIKDHGAKAGVALNPATPLACVEPVLGIVDYLLVMTVNPGFGGQNFIGYCRQKIVDLKKIIVAKNLDVLIEADGGIKVDHVGELSRLGVDVFVSGSGIFGTKDYQKTIALMREKMRQN